MADRAYGPPDRGAGRSWGRYGDVEVYGMKPRKGVERLQVNHHVQQGLWTDHVLHLQEDGGYKFGPAWGGDSDKDTQAALTRSEHFSRALEAARHD